MVEDLFEIAQRGLIIAPGVDLGARAQVELLVELRRPEVRCLSCAQGDDLQALIDADQEAAKSSNCPFAGCSTGIQYVYCDAPDLTP